MSLERLIEEHLGYCHETAAKYVSDMDARFQGSVWQACLSAAVDEVSSALTATNNLADVPGALVESGKYSRALRFLLGSPLSQDQFQLVCPSWPKSSEKTGRSLKETVAAEFGKTFEQWRDPQRTQALGDDAEKLKAIYTTAILIAQTEFATRKRMQLAQAQEAGAIRVLEEKGYVRVDLGIVDQPGVLAVGEFSQATQFQTTDGSSHEVDLAIGLRKKRILALECKVSNDKTNSVKRVNDVLKKADAWKKQWGRTVITGALLQGVFSDKEPRRLLEADVEIFWSHRLDLFGQWIQEES